MAGPRIRAACFFSGKGQSDYVVASPNYGYDLMSTSELLGKRHGAAALAGSYLTQLRPSAELVPRPESNVALQQRFQAIFANTKLICAPKCAPRCVRWGILSCRDHIAGNHRKSLRRRRYGAQSSFLAPVLVSMELIDGSEFQ